MPCRGDDVMCQIPAVQQRYERHCRTSPVSQMSQTCAVVCDDRRMGRHLPPSMTVKGACGRSGRQESHGTAERWAALAPPKSVTSIPVRSCLGDGVAPVRTALEVAPWNTPRLWHTNPRRRPSSPRHRGGPAHGITCHQEHDRVWLDRITIRQEGRHHNQW